MSVFRDVSDRCHAPTAGDWVAEHVEEDGLVKGIELGEGGQAEQPIVDAWIASVDTSKKRVVLENEDGLIR